MNNVKTILSALLMLASSLYSVAQEAPTKYVKALLVTTADGTQTKFALKEKPQLNIEKPYLVVKTNGIKTDFELEQMVSLKYIDVPVVPGDAYEDGLINTTDITTMVNYLMGKRESGFSFSNADANDDEALNVADIVKTGNIIHAGDFPATSRGENQDKSQTAARRAPSNDSAQRQYALYNYRNDDNFNAWLNIDIDSITYSKTDTLGVVHKDLVVQEVWTPDSTYRIPIEAIDSIGFRAPEPIMREGIFYLEDYHAAHTKSIDEDELTIFFDTSIDKQRLPSVGQVVLHGTNVTPYEEGFSGKVKSIESNSDFIKVECDYVPLGDIFERLVLVGKAVTDSENKSRAIKRSSDDDPWTNAFEHDVLTIKNIGDLSFEVLDGMISINSIEPTAVVDYTIFVDKKQFLISTNVNLIHHKLKKHINISLAKIMTLEKDYQDFFNVMRNPDGFSEWLDSYMQDNKDEKQKQKEKDLEKKDDSAEIDLLENFWKKHKKPVLNIPIGWFTISLEATPFLKLSGDLEADWEFETSARQFMHFEIKGSSLAAAMSLVSPKVACPLAKLAGSIESNNRASYDEDPNIPTKFDLKGKASFAVGIAPKLTVSLIHKNVLHASCGGKFGLKATYTKDITLLDINTNTEDRNRYERWKDTKIKVEAYAKVTAELGVTPSKFLALGAEWEVWSKDLGSLYLFPKFTAPSLPEYSALTALFGWGGYSPTALRTITTKSVFFPGKLGIGLYDGTGKRIYETFAENDYFLNSNWDNFLLQLELKNMPAGVTYTARPLFRNALFGTVEANPSAEITVGTDLQFSTDIIEIKKGKTCTVKITGGWGLYELWKKSAPMIEADLTKVEEDGQTFDVIDITATEIGKGLLVVYDKRTGQEKPISIEVIEAGEEELQLSSTLLTLVVGKQGTVKVSSGSGKYKTESSDTDVATVKINNGSIEVTAVNSGTATITVTDMETGQTANVKVVITKKSIDIPAEAVDLGLPSGTLWASYNVGATKPEEIGSYYAWGELEEKSVYSENAYTYYNELTNKYQDIGDDITYTQYDVAHVKWGKNWRMPTEEEWQELWNNCELIFERENGLWTGLRLKSLYNDNSIYFPWNTVNKPGEELTIYPNFLITYYWSSSIDPKDRNNSTALHYCLYVGDGISFVLGDLLESNSRYYGLPIRPVCSNYIVMPSSLDFETIPKNTSKKKAFVIRNTYSKPQSFEVSIDNNLYFELVGDTNFTLAEGEEKKVFVKCKGLPYKKNHEAIITLTSELETKKLRLQGYGGDKSYGDDAYAVLDNGTLSFYYDDKRDSRDKFTINVNLDINLSDEEQEFSHYYFEKVVFDPSFAKVKPTSTYSWFAYKRDLLEIQGLEYLNTSDVINMECMFYNCENLKELDVSHFDTQNVTNMESMFSGCKSIKELDVSHFNTQNVTNMRSMFYECESLTKLDVSRFNTSKVEDMGLMFRSCKSIKNLDVSNFTTSHAKIEQMFYGCENLLKIDVSNFDTSNTKDLDYLFADCYSLSVLDLSNFVTTNVTDTQGMFRGLKLKTIYCGNLWNMENVTNSRYMFDNCTNLVGGKGTKFDSNHTDAEYARIDGGPNSPGYFTDINASAVPVISVTPTEIDFGLVEYGTIKTKTFKVTNAGNASLTFHVPQASKSDQYFEVSDADAEFTLAPGNTKEYTVTCHGLNKGYKAWVDFRIISNAENGEQTVRVNSVGWDSTPLLAANSLTMNVGDGESIEMHGSNMGTYEITNSNPDIVSVEKGGDHGGSGTIGRTDGKYSFGYTSLDITALACGTATVKVIDTGTNEETIVSITVSGVVPEAVDLGLPSGTLWATCNVGATKPEEIGGRYAWGETEEKTRYREDNYLYNGQDIGSDIQGTEYDVAHVKWGNPWQMPTRNQFQELRDNCTMEHTTLNGRDGYKFIGSNGNSIFLPVDDNLPNGMGHAYWSSTASGDSSARSFRLSGDEVNYTGWSRDSGFSVRPVKNINTAGSGSTTDSGAGGV